MCCVFGLISFCSPALAGESSLLNCIPNNDEVPGWIRDGEAYIAINEGALFNFINGGAPFYLERGVVEAGFQDFIQNDLSLELEIYRTKNEESTKRLYDDIYVENPRLLKDMGTAGRFAASLVGVYMVEYWQQSFFVRLTISEKSAASKETILKFARVVSKKIHTIDK